MTDYIILRRTGDGQWQELDHDKITTSSAKRALALANLDAGFYVSVPARSWKPLTVKVETVSKVSIS